MEKHGFFNKKIIFLHFKLGILTFFVNKEVKEQLHMERNFTDIMFVIVSVLALIISICMAILIKDFDRINILSSAKNSEVFLQGVTNNA